MRRATAVLVLAALLAIGGPAAGATAGQYHRTHTAPGMAVYEWRTVGDLSATEVRRRLGFLREQGFRTVFLEIGNYLEAAEAAASDPELEGDLERIRWLIRGFVATATSHGMAVQALGGGPTWFGEDRRYLGQLLVELVADYNIRARYDERFQGVHLDLEPYTLTGWLGDPDNFHEYLVTIQGIVDTYRSLAGGYGNRNLQLGFAIPFWFDSATSLPGAVAFNGDTKPLAFHVIDMVSDLHKAYLVVMAYRSFTRTSNGSIALARDEFRYAAGIGARCGLVVGQRYGPATPDEATTTFYGLPRWVFRRAAAEIALAFRRYPQFRGLSVDDVDAYMAADA
jgi:hypothetical protein